MAHSKPRSKQRFPRPLWSLLTLLSAILCLSVSTLASAQSNVLVAPFQGSKPQGLRDLAIQLLEADGFTVAPGGESMSPEAGEYEVTRTAKEKHAVAVLYVTTGLTKTSWRSTLKVREGKSGKEVGEATISAKSYKGLQKAYKEKLISELMPLFEKCTEDESSAAPAGAKSDDDWDDKPAAEETPANELPPPDDDASSGSSEGSASLDLGPDENQQRRDSLKKTEALSLTLGPNLVLRSWEVQDPLTNASDGPLLPAHDVPAIGLRAGLLVFPAAFFTTDLVKHVGVQLDYAMSLVGQTNVENVTQDPDDKMRDTTLQSFGAGLHVRIPLDPLTLGIIGSYGFDALSVDGSKDRVAVPDLQTDYIRAGLLAQLALGKSTFARVALGYRHVLGFGQEAPQLQSSYWFPEALGKGFDARVEFRQMFTPAFGLALGGEYDRYAIDFNVQPNHVSNAAEAGQPAPPIAGGATDAYMRFDLSAVVSLGK